MSEHVTGTYESARHVREMFGHVAPRYDFLNHLLSMNIDRLWRAAVAREFRDILARPGARALDLCCGTGDLTLTLQQAGSAHVIGADFCHPMLKLAQEKLKRKSGFVEGDALQLPFADASFDLVTIAFGYRNLADYTAGLREMLRLLRPGGRVGILEASHVPGILGPAYRFYLSQVLPRIGAMISDDKGAYSYFAKTVERFPEAEELAEDMRAAGFSDVRFQRYTFGVACLHSGTRYS